MTATVSVVIPTYNRGRLTARAVLSAALQTRPPDEIIVVDDCSSDDTAEVVQRIIDRRAGVGSGGVAIRLLRQPRNAGANAARNAGIRAAGSRYIAFLDSDDLWHPDKLATQLARIEEQAASAWRPIFSYTARFRVDGQYRLVARQFPRSVAAARQVLRSNSIGTLSSIVVDRDLLLFAGLFDEGLRACQDWDMYIRTVPLAECVAVAAPHVIYFDGEIDRITRSSRVRLKAHLEIFRRYLRDRLPQAERREFYRNIAEDLAQLGRRRLAMKFHAEALVSRRRPPPLAWLLAHLANGRILEQRYRSYARSRRRMDRDAALRAENAHIGEQYQAFIRAIDELAARLGAAG